MARQSPRIFLSPFVFASLLLLKSPPPTPPAAAAPPAFCHLHSESKEKISSNKREEIKEGRALVFEGGLREEIEEESSVEIAGYC
ncbi:hypothetical protein K1719_002841 [Acacia pycnantha]|nr:hypothetical protein K1719_002841 [Acacia pycnantha]